MNKVNHQAGFISIIGKPNVGKSTFLNNIINSKISIVTNKAQTTRNQIRAILNDETYQMVFFDTPGFHKKRQKLSNVMNSVVLKTIASSDIIILICEATSKLKENDELIIKELNQIKKISKIVLVSKVDLVKKTELLDFMKVLDEKIKDCSEIFPFSNNNKKDIEKIKKLLLKYLPKNLEFFPKGEVHHLSNHFIFSELIREKILLKLREEVPHSIFVSIETIKDNKSNNIITIHATINVEKDSQKMIVIGKGGNMIKQIGIDARKELEQMYDCKINLQLFVKVQKNWRDDLKTIKQNKIVE